MNLSFFIARRMARPSPENRPGVMSRIAVVSVAVSVAVMLVALAVILGFKREVTARMVGFSAPVEVIDGAGIYAAESRPVAATARFEALLRAVDGVQRATPYAVKSGIVRTRDAMEGVALKGVDGSYDWSFFAGRLTEGRLPRVGDSLRTKELLLSARTARLLGVHAGDKVEMLFVAGDERPRRDRFKVSGLYSTGMEELERTALTDLRNVQRLSGWSSGEVSGYDLFLGDVRQADRLAEAVNDALLRSDLPETDGVVVGLRAVKDRYEIARMRGAQSITDAAFEHIVRYMRPGMMERQVQLELEEFMLRHGAQGLAFPSIVATGPNGASPHAIPGATMLEAGQCVVLDFGARSYGYCSDMTRTVFLGEPDPEMRAAWDALREANESVEAMLRPGVTGKEAHERAEEVLAAAGFGGRMGHGLGHGVGIDIHEEPVLAPRNERPLVAGNVVTVEPGIYLPGKCGMRLEDFGVVTDDGFDVFTNSTHDLVVI